MSTNTLSRSFANPIGGLLILTALVGLPLGILWGGWYALYALAGIFAFILFTGYPVLGLYATTALLLLSGSAGIIGFVDDQAALAVTLAKLCGMAALAAWIISLLLCKSAPRFNNSVTALCFFCVWALAGTVLSGEVALTWPEWVRLITLLGFFLLAVNTLNSAQNIHNFIVIILLCGMAMSFVAVAQHYLPSFQFAGAEAWASLGAVDGAYIDQESLQGEAAIRSSGRAGHSNWLAMILLLVLPLNAYWFSVSKKRSHQLIVLCSVAVGAVALILTYTRTGFVIGVVLALLLLFKRLVRLTPQRLFGALMLLVIVWLMLPGAYKERVFSPKQYTGSQSVNSRLELQESAFRYAVENPLVGLGAGGFGPNFIRENNQTAQTMKFMVERQGWHPVFIGAHNMFLEIAATSGFVGLAIFLFFYVVTLRRTYQLEAAYRKAGDKQGEALASSLFVSLVGFILCAVFLHALTQKIWWMIAAAAIALPLHAISFKEHDNQSAVEGESAVEQAQ